MKKRKKCTVCNEKKDINDFYKHTSNLDGRFNKCIPCLLEERKFQRMRKIRVHLLNAG